MTRCLLKLLSRTVFISFLFLSIHSSSVQAQMGVFLDFDSAWETNLNTAAASAGVTSFSQPEITLIENNILNEMSTVFQDYSLLSIATSAPTSGAFTTVDFGATGSGAFGSAPLDYFNLSGTQSANMFIENFDFTINEFTGSTNRANQIEQISVAISGTAAHELGHTMGLHHHHAYGTAAINPSNYANTGGAQNAHYLATGATGINESERESVRTLSQWSKLLLETPGGMSTVLHGNTGFQLADTPLIEQDFANVPDVSGDTSSASAIATVALAISGYDQAANVFSQLESNADVDVFSVDINGVGQLTAEIVSASRWGDSFDSFLEILDTDGTTVLATLDDARYSGDVYGTGTSGVTDTFLVNVELDGPGTYFLRVSSFNNASAGDYSLVLGANVIASVPEPSGLVLFAAGGLLMANRRRRHV